MAKRLTISDAVDAFDLYALYSEIIDSYEEEFYAQSPEASDLYDLIAEHEDIYEFSPDSDGDYSESFERNLKDALAVVFEELGLDGDFEHDYSDDDDMEDALEDDDMDGSYMDGYEDEEETSQTQGDFDDFDEDRDD